MSGARGGSALRRGIEFLTAAGHITDDRRQEFMLLSDVLGLSMHEWDFRSGSTLHEWDFRAGFGSRMGGSFVAMWRASGRAGRGEGEGAS